MEHSNEHSDAKIHLKILKVSASVFCILNLKFV